MRINARQKVATCLQEYFILRLVFASMIVFAFMVLVFAKEIGMSGPTKCEP